MNDFTTSVAMWLADYFLLGTVLLLLAMATLSLLRQPAQRLAVTKSTLVALLILAALSALPGWSLIHLLSTEQPRPNGSQVVVNHVEPINEPAPIAAPHDDAGDKLQAPVQIISPATPQRSAFVSTLAWPTILASMYALGSACVFVWLCLGCLAAHRLVHSATPAPTQLTNLIAQLTNHDTHDIRLLLSTKIDVAVAIGIRRPAILVPQSLPDLVSPLVTRRCRPSSPTSSPTSRTTTSTGSPPAAFC